MIIFFITHFTGTLPLISFELSHRFINYAFADCSAMLLVFEHILALKVKSVSIFLQ